MEGVVKYASQGRFYVVRPMYLYVNGKWYYKCDATHEGGYYLSEAEARTALERSITFYGDGEGI